jgi:hypothetical protein
MAPAVAALGKGGAAGPRAGGGAGARARLARAPGCGSATRRVDRADAGPTPRDPREVREAITGGRGASGRAGCAPRLGAPPPGGRGLGAPPAPAPRGNRAAQAGVGLPRGCGRAALQQEKMGDGHTRLGAAVRAGAPGRAVARADCMARAGCVARMRQWGARGQRGLRGAHAPVGRAWPNLQGGLMGALRPRTRRRRAARRPAGDGEWAPCAAAAGHGGAQRGGPVEGRPRHRNGPAPARRARGHQVAVADLSCEGPAVGTVFGKGSARTLARALQQHCSPDSWCRPACCAVQQEIEGRGKGSSSRARASARASGPLVAGASSRRPARAVWARGRRPRAEDAREGSARRGAAPRRGRAQRRVSSKRERA